MASQNEKNVTISLGESAVNVDNEMLIVKFNQFQIEPLPQTQEAPTFQSNSTVDSGPVEKQLSASLTETSEIQPEETTLQSASQLFQDDSNTSRNRTTSDNEFFDHLVAGDSAMMADENVSDIIPAEVTGDMISHCSSSAKLSVTSDSDQNFPNELENNTSNFARESKSNNEDGIVIKIAKEPEITKDGEAKINDAAVQSSEVSPRKSEDNDDIPVFRYFSEDSIHSSVMPDLAFDTFSSVVTPEVDNGPKADAFSAALEESEFRRRSDAWIPSQSTQAVLASQTESSCSHLITKPKLIVSDALNDPILPIMVSNVEPSLIASRKAKTLTQDSVQPNESGLQKLMEMGCYRAAINLTTKLIQNSGQASKLTPELLQLWFCRIGLLVKVKMLKEAYEESLPFLPCLDNPDVYYSFNTDSRGRKGSMASFGFRLLLAEIPRYVGQYEQSLEQLHVLRNKVMLIIKNLDSGLSEDGNKTDMKESNRKASQDLWCQRERNVMYSLVNACTAHKDYVLAINLMNSLIEKESKDRIPFLWSAKGRIFLQLGNVVGAQDCFDHASSAVSDELKPNEELQIMELINRALIAIAQNNFDDAYNFYKEASELHPSDPVLKNNMAACLLYVGKMKESLSTLEDAIKNDPENFLHEGILFNVCTLYELESSHSNQKKANMLALISQHKGDSFNTACLKIS